jgi:protein-S-isoprenylcysteine O-methyltransferase Ste14
MPILWLRALLFTALVPVMVGGIVPLAIAREAPAAGGPWQAGWIAVAAGGAIYLLSLLQFLASGGTPMIFFARRARAVFGEEPPVLVCRGVYRVSRNPMYLAVLLAAGGLAIVFASVTMAVYAAALAVFFQIVVVAVEEPHLRRRHGAAFDAYCLRVRRW